MKNNETWLTDWSMVQVMVWCCQAISHYQRRSWPNSKFPYGVTYELTLNSSVLQGQQNIVQNALCLALACMTFANTVVTKSSAVGFTIQVKLKYIFFPVELGTTGGRLLSKLAQSFSIWICIFPQPITWLVRSHPQQTWQVYWLAACL